MKKTLIALILITVLGITGVVYAHTRQKPFPEPNPDRGGQTNVQPELTPDGIFNLVNKARETNSVADLQLSPELTKSAQEKCDDMAANNYFSHTSPTTNTINGFDYVKAELPNSYKIGENLDNQISTSNDDVVAGWLKSTDHRDIMLDSDYTISGVALCQSTGSLYHLIVEHFANIQAPQTTYVPAQSSGTLCNDGWVSPSTGRGTCSWHHGEAH